MNKELEALDKLWFHAKYDLKQNNNLYFEYLDIYKGLKKALTPPTAEEVCEHLNESFGLKGKNTNLHFIYDKESREFRMVSQGKVYRYISTKRQSEDSIDFIDLDINDIIILGQFYKGESK